MLVKFYGLSLIVLFCFLETSAQSDTVLYLREIRWRFTLPANFKISNSDFISRTVDLETLFTATSENGDFFNVACDSADKLTLKTWEASDVFYIVTILNAMRSRGFKTSRQVDGAYQVGGVSFKKFERVGTNAGQSEVHLLYLSTFYKNHYILINYFYRNNPDEMFSMLTKSQFY
jgi:hypothetical protein